MAAFSSGLSVKAIRNSGFGKLVLSIAETSNMLEHEPSVVPTKENRQRR